MNTTASPELGAKSSTTPLSGYTPPSQTPSGTSASAGGAPSEPNAGGEHSLPERAREAVQHTREAVQGTYEHARHAAEEGLARGETYVRENPLPSVLGALAIGTLLGFVIGISRREEMSFRARLAEDPYHVIRDSVFAAMAPFGDRLHEGYDSARERAGKVLDKAHHNAARCSDSWLHSLGRAGSHLKFW